jgi:hypothetical protein
MLALKRSRSSFVGFRALSSSSAQQGRQCSSWSKPLPDADSSWSKPCGLFGQSHLLSEQSPYDAILPLCTYERQQTIHTNQIAGKMRSVLQRIPSRALRQSTPICFRSISTTSSSFARAEPLPPPPPPPSPPVELAKLEAIEAGLTKLDAIEAKLASMHQSIDKIESNVHYLVSCSLFCFYFFLLR